MQGDLAVDCQGERGDKHRKPQFRLRKCERQRPRQHHSNDRETDIPDGVDLAKYPSVVIWCEQFGVLISPAPLGPPR